MTPTTFYIHVNLGTIDSNRKHGKSDPPIAIKKGKSGKAIYASEIELAPGSKIIYNPKGILSCGARLVIISPEMPTIVR